MVLQPCSSSSKMADDIVSPEQLLDLYNKNRLSNEFLTATTGFFSARNDFGMSAPEAIFVNYYSSRPELLKSNIETLVKDVATMRQHSKFRFEYFYRKYLSCKDSPGMKILNADLVWTLIILPLLLRMPFTKREDGSYDLISSVAITGIESELQSLSMPINDNDKPDTYVDRIYSIIGALASRPALETLRRYVVFASDHVKEIIRTKNMDLTAFVERSNVLDVFKRLADSIGFYDILEKYGTEKIKSLREIRQKFVALVSQFDRNSVNRMWVSCAIGSNCTPMIESADIPIEDETTFNVARDIIAGNYTLRPATFSVLFAPYLFNMRNRKITMNIAVYNALLKLITVWCMSSAGEISLSSTDEIFDKAIELLTFISKTGIRNPATVLVDSAAMCFSELLRTWNVKGAMTMAKFMKDYGMFDPKSSQNLMSAISNRMTDVADWIIENKCEDPTADRNSLLLRVLTMLQPRYTRELSRRETRELIKFFVRTFYRTGGGGSVNDQLLGLSATAFSGADPLAITKAVMSIPGYVTQFGQTIGEKVYTWFLAGSAEPTMEWLKRCPRELQSHRLEVIMAMLHGSLLNMRPENTVVTIFEMAVHWKVSYTEMKEYCSRVTNNIDVGYVWSKMDQERSSQVLPQFAEHFKEEIYRKISGGFPVFGLPYPTYEIVKPQLMSRTRAIFDLSGAPKSPPRISVSERSDVITYSQENFADPYDSPPRSPTRYLYPSTPSHPITQETPDTQYVLPTSSSSTLYPHKLQPHTEIPIPLLPPLQPSSSLSSTTTSVPESFTFTYRIPPTNPPPLYPPAFQTPITFIKPSASSSSTQTATQPPPPPPSQPPKYPPTYVNEPMSCFYDMSDSHD